MRLRHGNMIGRSPHESSSAMLRAFCDAVERRDGAAFAALFTEDGVYTTCSTAPLPAARRSPAMIDDWFYRTATDFRWDMHAPVSDGKTLYARYTFSYRSTLAGSEGRARHVRGRRDHDSCATARSPRYHEVANTATGFVDMNFAAERIAKIVARQGAALKARPEMKRHLDGVDDELRSKAAAVSASACAAPARRRWRCRSGPVRHRASIRRSRCRRWRGGSPPRSRSIASPAGGADRA